ncbi:hypothetical protein [Brevundimonas guildfordensis]|uniref:Uncharacterized protein n=1 Tax=Brevundimonas guildfordensis TaxID=2762241 RepID=A0ABR8R102_9CAUL|nr:hypothetical protein [Brevundimonas guildfordensis]MBD7941451.1 hypothetical protein [Brevundimonas guildfordensis]
MTHQDPHSHSADAVETHHAVEAQYVRQGRGGRRILMVLIVSAGAAAVLLLGLWAATNASLHETPEATSMTPEPPPVTDTDPAARSVGPESAPPVNPAPAA